jgi:hypothetical protein
MNGFSRLKWDYLRKRRGFESPKEFAQSHTRLPLMTTLYRNVGEIVCMKPEIKLQHWCGEPALQCPSSSQLRIKTLAKTLRQPVRTSGLGSEEIQITVNYSSDKV